MNISKTAEKLYERTRALRTVITENQEEIDAIERLLSIWEKEETEKDDKKEKR